MKKRMTIITVFIVMLLTGCSFLDEVNNSLDYVNEATDYVNTVSEFGTDIKAITENAINNPEGLTQLENELQIMKEEINNFIAINPPALAESVHQQISNYSEQLEAGITQFLDEVTNGVINPNFLEDSEILKTISDITNLLNQIEQLGL